MNAVDLKLDTREKKPKVVNVALLTGVVLVLLVLLIVSFFMNSGKVNGLNKSIAGLQGELASVTSELDTAKAELESVSAELSAAADQALTGNQFWQTELSGRKYDV